MTGLRIAVASSGLGHVARGIEAWAADLGAALHARGERVTLYKGGGTASLPYERVVPCWRRDNSPTKRAWFPTRLLWRAGFGSPYMAEQTTFAWRLIPHLRRQRADILHVQDPFVALAVQRARRLGLVSTKAILAHGTEEPPEFLKKIDYLQHLAPWHLENARAAGAWKPIWTAIPNFIDTERFSPGRSLTMRDELGIPQHARVTLCAAAIKRHHKRIDYLIDEFTRLPEDLLIVAGGWEPETDGVIAEGRAKLGDRVRFLVRFPRERMPELYRAADLFVLPSLFEMMPIAIVEAAASGLPCITHDHPVPRWIAGAGGLAADMARPGALAEAIAGLHAAEVSRLGAAARQHCLENFGTEAVVRQILDYYQRVAAD